MSPSHLLYISIEDQQRDVKLISKITTSYIFQVFEGLQVILFLLLLENSCWGKNTFYCRHVVKVYFQVHSLP